MKKQHILAPSLIGSILIKVENGWNICGNAVERLLYDLQNTELADDDYYFLVDELKKEVNEAWNSRKKHRWATLNLYCHEIISAIPEL